MSTQSSSGKKNMTSQQPISSGGLMEELNLPPQLILFVKKNSRNLQIGLIGFVVLVLAVIFYDYYAHNQAQKGASLLATGLQTEAADQQTQVFDNVIKEYGHTAAARWAELELAHQDYKEGKFEAAAAKYKEILDTLSADNPLVPLTRLSLAQSYEQSGEYDLDMAVTEYNLLKNATGFANQAYLGLGRIYMAKKDLVQARQAYEELSQNLGESSDPELKAMVEAKLAALEEADQSVIPSQPEENKE
ncbi:MAG: YfgM family protein [Desulfobulbales bacterium]